MHFDEILRNLCMYVRLGLLEKNGRVGMKNGTLSSKERTSLYCSADFSVSIILSIVKQFLREKYSGEDRKKRFVMHSSLMNKHLRCLQQNISMKIIDSRGYRHSLEETFSFFPLPQRSEIFFFECCI